jgi:hypothetical protein
MPPAPLHGSLHLLVSCTTGDDLAKASLLVVARAHQRHCKADFSTERAARRVLHFEGPPKTLRICDALHVNVWTTCVIVRDAEDASFIDLIRHLLS